MPHGTIVDSADAVSRLPRVTHAHAEFNEDVVEVNRGLAAAYRRLLAAGQAAAPALAGGQLSSEPISWDERWARPKQERF